MQASTLCEKRFTNLQIRGYELRILERLKNKRYMMSDVFIGSKSIIRECHIPNIQIGVV